MRGAHRWRGGGGDWVGGGDDWVEGGNWLAVSQARIAGSQLATGGGGPTDSP